MEEFILKRISALFITLIVILGSMGAATAAVGGNNTSNSTQNSTNKNAITQSVANTSDANWTSNNYDPNMSRNSPQTTINTTNVNKLVVKWTFNTGSHSIESPPLIVGNTCYVQNILLQIFSLNLISGQLNWIYDPHVNVTKNPHSEYAHGMFYYNGIIYAPTGSNGTVIALNATNGKLKWQSPLIDSQNNYYNPSPPIIWKNYIIVGGGGGDYPPLKGSVTALNKTTGKIIWHITTTVGPWVQGSKASVNGGGTVWSGGAFDQYTGIIYLPVGNPSPDFNASTRQGNTSYTNCMIAVNITNGHIIWATPFIQVGTVLNVTTTDTHDDDTSWGSQLVTVKTNNGTSKLLIGHDKHGDLMAMNATNGKPLWWYNLASLYSPAIFTAIYCYCANDYNTLYIQGSGSVHGTIAAIDLLTGKLKWKIISNASYGSPLVTNGILFASNATNGTGVIMALNKSTGHLIWQHNVGSPIGEGGPSIGQGMLLVPTTSGKLVAFGLNGSPTNQTVTASVNQVASAASSVKTFYETNNKLPNYVTITNQQVSMPQFLNLLAKGIIQVNSDSTTPIAINNVNPPTSPSGSFTSGNILKSEYLNIAQSIISFITTNGRAPDNVTTYLGKINFKYVVYLYSKIMNLYKTINRLPNYVSI